MGETTAPPVAPDLADATLSLVAGRGVQGHLGDGGPATLAQLDGPSGVAVDGAGGIVVVDTSNRVRRVAFATITTVAGSGAAERRSAVTPPPGDGGPATDAQLDDPNGVAVDAAGAILVADTGYDRIRPPTSS